MSDGGGGSSSGPATDQRNDPVVDPTRNVLDLVSAAIARQDDLRKSESDHVRELMAIRSEFAKDLRIAESQRIDAIRAVDVGAVQRAAEVSATQASTLAMQVATSAETLRAQVAATASANVTGLAAALAPMQKDIADLRQAQYEAQGQKTQIVEGRATGGNTALWVGVALAALGFFVSVVAVAVAVYLATKS